MARANRISRAEQLEQRWTLTSDWQNPMLCYDVDDSKSVTPIDALYVINELNSNGSRSLTGHVKSIAPFLDTDGDEQLSAIDALGVINTLNSKPTATIDYFQLKAGQDVNQNGTVVTDSVIAEIRSSGAQYVEVERVSPGNQAAMRVDVGSATISLQLSLGENVFDVTALDPMGRTSSSQLIVTRGNLVTDFNAALLNVIRDWSTTSNDPYQGRTVTSQPPAVAVNLATVHLAMYEAMAAGHGLAKSLLGVPLQATNPKPDVAGVWAAYSVVQTLYGDTDEHMAWDATLLELAPETQDLDYVLSKQLGQSAGAKAIELARQQGATAHVYEKTDGLTAWQRTAPDFLPPLLPSWGHRTGFIVADASVVRPQPPPDVGSDAYTKAVDEVMRLGGAASVDRTAEQSEIALFWADGGGTATPAGHWNRIASDVVERSSLSTLESARTFALVNIAMADAGVAAWDSKYFYDLWRPIDAIRKADMDGNPQTVADPNWIPFLRTPPFPTYVSGHSAFSAAAATVLTALFGNDRSFSSTTDGHTGLGQRPLASGLITTRNFANFMSAAEEASKSRIYGGIHFSFDCQIGLELGQSVGTRVINTLVGTSSS